MKKFSKVFVAILVAAAVFVSTNVITATAETINSTLSGVAVTASSSITKTSGYASTFARSGTAYVEVSARYGCMTPFGVDAEEMSGSNANILDASLYFSAPEGKESFWITADHYVESGSETWSAYTSDER